MVAESESEIKRGKESEIKRGRRERKASEGERAFVC